MLSKQNSEILPEINIEVKQSILQSLRDEFGGNAICLPDSQEKLKLSNLMHWHSFSEDFDETLLQLFLSVSDITTKRVFPCAIESLKIRNAMAENRSGIPIVGIFLPLVADILSLSHAFSFYYSEYFCYAGEVSKLRRYEFKFCQPSFTETGIDMDCHPNVKNRMLANIMASISIKWVLLHETGHHHFDHLKNIECVRLFARDNKFCSEPIDYQKMEFEADVWAVLHILNEFEVIELYVKKCYSRRISKLDVVKIIYLSIIMPLLVVDEGITDKNMKLVDHPSSMHRQVTITSAFRDFFRQADNHQLQRELCSLYKKRGSQELFTDAVEYFYRDMDLMVGINEKNAKAIDALFGNWLMSMFS